MRTNRLILIAGMALALTGGRLAAQTEAEYEAEYARRIQLEMINDVYIPADMAEAFVELNRLADPTGIDKFRSSQEDVIRHKLHFGLGRWMLVNWGLEEGSRYGHHLREMGITSPDDMVQVTLVAWHRHLNGKPLGLEEEIARIEQRTKEEKAKLDARKTYITIEKRPHQPKED